VLRITQAEAAMLKLRSESVYRSAASWLEGRFRMKVSIYNPGSETLRYRFIERSPFQFLVFLGLSEPVVSQISYLLPVRQIGALSILQCYRTGIWLVLILLMLVGRPAKTRTWWETKALYYVGHGCILVWVMNDLLKGIGLSQLATYFKISYWLSWCFCICLYVQNAKQAKRLLKALVWGGILTCLFVYWGYITGKGLVETYAEQVDASLGAKGSSGKTVPAYLATVGLLSVYLWRHRRAFLPILLACFLFGGMMLTYRRSAQVGLVLALIWLCAWRALFAMNSKDASFVGRLVFVAALGFMLFLLGVGSTGLQNRWQHVATSHRLEYWHTSIEFFFKRASLIQVLFGVGQDQMHKYMSEAGFGWIHTHSDLFDLLFLGGITTGLLFYAFLWYVVWRLFRKIDLPATESAFAGSVICVFLTVSLLSGQLGAVNTMFIYIAAIICLPIIAEPHNYVPFPKLGL